MIADRKGAVMATAADRSEPKHARQHDIHDALLIQANAAPRTTRSPAAQQRANQAVLAAAVHELYTHWRCDPTASRLNAPQSR